MMIVRHTARLAVLAAVDLRSRSLLAGGCVGWLTWALSCVGASAAETLPIALLFLLSASAAFVLHALHLRMTARARADRAHLAADARRCVSWLGAGIATALHGLQALGG